MPWVPLMHAAEPPEVVLRRCREVIDQHAPAAEHESLLTVTEVFTRLRYKDPKLLSILQRFPLNLSCERKTICNMLFGNWLWQQTRSSHCTLSMLLVL